MAMSLSPALSLSSSPCPKTRYHHHHSSTTTGAYHSRTNSESLLFTPPLSPTEEQLLAFLIPDIEPSELAAYLSAPATPILSDVSCLIGRSLPVADDHHSSDASSPHAEAVYPSPVCAAAAATVVALDRLDSCIYPSLPCPPEDHSNSVAHYKKKRCSTYAFMGSDDEEEEEREEPLDFLCSPVYVMSSRNTRKRLMLEQAFVSPDDEEDCSSQNCYAQIFQGASSEEVDSASDLFSTLAFDLVMA
ncbi:hypothetical protein BC939DRAFT_467891 [Gamsiella multidivaricata]|uniref:uncharacterized protein n=1 Tax=Gamsiella multidivaricata TaxID=101098 RepID=UPI0022203F7C|nr:uncharacterized protein BC939DRAFT_467891 [Gamsiella multidivaricata]KAG0366103.1 hypothetical protein BGZ54_005802 [Gamsiella multidivaricata]KAI7816733.1 hypothetical protein BC939DRAFT_467891 [Gamsiella multidivaricata]